MGDVLGHGDAGAFELHQTFHRHRMSHIRLLLTDVSMSGAACPSRQQVNTLLRCCGGYVAPADVAALRPWRAGAGLDAPGALARHTAFLPEAWALQWFGAGTEGVYDQHRRAAERNSQCGRSDASRDALHVEA